MTDKKLCDAYNAGYDCGCNGSNTTNTHFTFFATDESRRQWEKGKADAEADIELEKRKKYKSK